jgi:hypothetical protein
VHTEDGQGADEGGGMREGRTHCGSKHVDHAYSLRLWLEIIAAACAGAGDLLSHPRGIMSSCSVKKRRDTSTSAMVWKLINENLVPGSACEHAEGAKYDVESAEKEVDRAPPSIGRSMHDAAECCCDCVWLVDTTSPAPHTVALSVHRAPPQHTPTHTNDTTVSSPAAPARARIRAPNRRRDSVG